MLYIPQSDSRRFGRKESFMKLHIDGYSVTPKPEESLFDMVKELGLVTRRLSEDPIAAKIAGRLFT
jgi:hypothetical protein